MFCPSCGVHNDQNARFCTNCGLTLQTQAGGRPADGTMVDGNADGTMVDGAPSSVLTPQPGPVVPPVVSPTVSPAVPPTVPNGPLPPPAKQGKSGGVGMIIVAAIVVIAILIGGTVWYLNTSNSNGVQPATQSQETTKPKKKAKKADGKSSDKSGESDKSDKTGGSGKSSKAGESDESDKPGKSGKTDASKERDRRSNRILDKSSTDSIVDGYSTIDVGVSVMNEDGLRSYSSCNASLSFVAAGLYLPAWLDYHDTYGDRPDAYADSLTGMNNGSANGLIDAVGGESDLNEWLSDNKYYRTRLERDYGDVKASQNGYENYASPDDAARMLNEMAENGDDGLMNYDIASEGVAIPSGATVHAHRGQGIKDSYNYFMVISNGKKKVSVAVMTQNQGRAVAAQLASRMLDKVWNTMLRN